MELHTKRKIEAIDGDSQRVKSKAKTLTDTDKLNEYHHNLKMKLIAEISILFFQYMKKEYNAVHEDELSDSKIVYSYHEKYDDMDSSDLVIKNIIEPHYLDQSLYLSFKWRNLNFKNLTIKDYDTQEEVENNGHDGYAFFTKVLRRKFREYLSTKECKMKLFTRNLWQRNVFMPCIRNHTKGEFQFQIYIYKKVY